MTTFAFSPDYTVKPGETIVETITCLGMSKAAFARHMGIEPAHLHKLISAKKPITPEIALKLEAVTHTPASFWNNLESNYRSAEMRRHTPDDENMAWLKAHPVKEMLARGWISGETPQARLQSLLNFYRVATPKAWADVWGRPLAAARVSPKYVIKREATAAFLCAGENDVIASECRPYEASRLRETLPELRRLTLRSFSMETLVSARRLLAEVGVALRIVKALRGVPLNGATRWVRDTPLVILTLRTGRADQVWFALFHELRHVLAGKKTASFLTFGQDWADSEEERIADEFAAEQLLPKKFNAEICHLQSFRDFQAFAQKVGVSVSVVIGRWQHLTGNFVKYTKSIQSLKWPEGVYSF